MVEKFFNSDYGIAGICVLLTIFILMKVGEFVWKIREQRDNSSEQALKQLTEALDNNTKAVEHLEKVVSEFPKFKIDIRRFYTAIKILSGEQWPEIRKEIMEDSEL